MSYFIVEICTDNASFEDEGKANEISRILKKIAGKIGAGGGDGRCADINGNTVATYFFGPAPSPISPYKIKSAEACLICDKLAAESSSYCESHQFCLLEGCKYMASPAELNGYCSAGCAALDAPLDYEPENGGDE